MGEIAERLLLLGYRYKGTMGIAGRHAFTVNPLCGERTFPAQSWMRHHLYVCHKESPSLKNHICFRDYLRSHPKMADEYAALKYKLANEALTKQWYVSEKTKFITKILGLCGFSVDAIEEIRRANK